MLRFKVNDSVSSTPFIFHVYASIEKESGLLKLYNPFPINQRLMMQEKNYKNIHYVFPKYHKFNRLLAKEQALKIDFVEREFNFKLNLLGKNHNTMEVCMDLYFDYESGIREYKI
jgi:hypothetical protein